MKILNITALGKRYCEGKMTNKELCYDRLIKFLEIEKEYVKQYTRSGGIVEEAALRAFQSKMNLLDRLKQDVKLFWVDEMTSDSLLNSPYSLENFTNFQFKLPFPLMFFDFDKGFGYRFIEGGKETLDLKLRGLLFSRLDDSWGGDEKIGSQGFKVYGFTNDGKWLVTRAFYLKEDETLVVTEELPRVAIKNNEEQISETRQYLFNLKERGLSRVNLQISKPYKSEERIYFEKKENNEKKEIYYKVTDDDYVDSFKLANLAINTIDYVNAQNVVIKEQIRSEKRRIFRTVKEGGKRGRIKRKSKVIEVQLKPYYWIEIKKAVIYKRDREKGESQWTINCRFWVRGHPRRYPDGHTLWIEPFIKGPENAPWKNNRYEMLYKRFKYLLENFEFRRGPASEEWTKLNRALREIKDDKKD